MKLLEIVKHLPWPDGAVIVVQGAKGTLSYHSGIQIIKRFEAAEIADDYDEELVTRGEWVAAQIDMCRTAMQP